MTNQGFGGDWTTDKLDRLRKYLEAYMVIFSRNPKARMLQTTYVDAFAGTGYRKRDSSKTGQTALFQDLAEPEAEEFLKGSPRIALEIANPFSKYLFVERDPSRAKELEKLKADFPTKAPAISIVEGDANAELRKWVSETNWREANSRQKDGLERWTACWEPRSGKMLSIELKHSLRSLGMRKCRHVRRR